MADPTTAAQLEAVRDELDRLRHERDRLIRLRRGEGASLRRIAAEAGLTAPGVRWVLQTDPT